MALKELSNELRQWIACKDLLETKRPPHVRRPKPGRKRRPLQARGIHLLLEIKGSYHTARKGTLQAYARHLRLETASKLAERPLASPRWRAARFQAWANKAREACEKDVSVRQHRLRAVPLHLRELRHGQHWPAPDAPTSQKNT